MPEILSMLGIAGIVAIPGSMFVGFIDTRLGTKKAGILVNLLAVIAVAFNLNSIMTGVGITVVGIIGTNFSYMAAYQTMCVLAVIGLIAMIALKVEPIDKEVR